MDPFNPRDRRTHILRLLGPKTILYKAFGLFLIPRVRNPKPCTGLICVSTAANCCDSGGAPGRGRGKAGPQLS